MTETSCWRPSQDLSKSTSFDPLHPGIEYWSRLHQRNQLLPWWQSVLLSPWQRLQVELFCAWTFRVHFLPFSGSWASMSTWPISLWLTIYTRQHQDCCTKLAARLKSTRTWFWPVHSILKASRLWLEAWMVLLCGMIRCLDFEFSYSNKYTKKLIMIFIYSRKAWLQKAISESKFDLPSSVICLASKNTTKSFSLSLVSVTAATTMPASSLSGSSGFGMKTASEGWLKSPPRHDTVSPVVIFTLIKDKAWLMGGLIQAKQSLTLVMALAKNPLLMEFIHPMT